MQESIVEYLQFIKKLWFNNDYESPHSELIIKKKVKELELESYPMEMFEKNIIKSLEELYKEAQRLNIHVENSSENQIKLQNYCKTLKLSNNDINLVIKKLQNSLEINNKVVAKYSAEQFSDTSLIENKSNISIKDLPNPEFHYQHLQINEFNNFYESLSTLKCEMTKVDSQNNSENERLTSLFEETAQSIKNKKVSETIKNQNALSDIIKISETALKNAIENWRVQIKKHQRELKFRNEFNNSLILMIYGKVKAGKSSFGNFIAKNKLQGQELQYFKYNKDTGQKQMIDGFEVKSTECTSEIQGFNLSGLTFIDTPGLGSMTTEYGNLAKEFVKSADLIIFPYPSDSPGRQSDNNELKELVDNGQSFIIIITKSDVCEEDEVDGKLVKNWQNKDIPTRKAQEGYVLNEVSKQSCDNLKCKDIISISTYVAQNAIKSGNKNDLYASKLPYLFEKITEIIKKDSVKLKINSPKEKLKTFIKNCIGNSMDNHNEFSIYKIKQKFMTLSNDIIKKQKNFQEKRNSILLLIQNDIDPNIRAIIDKSSGNLNELKDKIQHKVQEIVQLHLKKSICEILNDFGNKLEKEFPIEINEDEITIKDKTETIVYNNSHKKAGVGATLGALAGMAAATFFSGGLALIAGAAFSFFGSAAGNGIAESIDSKRVEEIVTGNNIEEIIYNISQKSFESASIYVQNTFESLDIEYFKPLLNYSSEIITILDILETNLKREFLNDKL